MPIISNSLVISNRKKTVNTTHWEIHALRFFLRKRGKSKIRIINKQKKSFFNQNEHIRKKQKEL